jgi:replication factor C subunit 3/5
LICNYICKIEDSLKNEFICIRFNQLPASEIIAFMKHVVHEEQIDIDDDTIEKIQSQYCSDIRSMINFIQSNCYSHVYIANKQVWELLYEELRKNIDKKEMSNYVYTIEQQYNMNSQQIIIHFFNYILRNKPEQSLEQLLSIMEMLLHNSEDIPSTVLTDFFVGRMVDFFQRPT